MEKKLSVLSIVMFSFALPALIVVDWYWEGYGLFFQNCPFKNSRKGVTTCYSSGTLWEEFQSLF